MKDSTQKPLTNSVSVIESQLIDLSIAIGSIAECNPTFTQGLASYIHSLNKPLSKITLSELVQLTDDYRKAHDDDNHSVKAGASS